MIRHDYYDWNALIQLVIKISFLVWMKMSMNKISTTIPIPCDFVEHNLYIQ